MHLRCNKILSSAVKAGRIPNKLAPSAYFFLFLRIGLGVRFKDVAIPHFFEILLTNFVEESSDEPGAFPDGVKCRLIKSRNMSLLI